MSLWEDFIYTHRGVLPVEDTTTFIMLMRERIFVLLNFTQLLRLNLENIHSLENVVCYKKDSPTGVQI